ncbi:MAG TPA: DoxX family protein [Nitrospinaceae bacterium]|jgi:putative oxidoreductase|nr:DoxX family protein [Nitrospinaceae bacterium]
MAIFFKYLFQTNASFSYWVPRVILGCVMFPHGAQKLFGWFGGFGFTNTMTYFTETAGLPWIIAFLIIMGESLGSLGLIVGFFTRLSAFGLICIMVGAIITVHIPNGLFMNWFGKQAGEGFEYHLLVIGISIPLLVSGGGKYSVDELINKKILKTTLSNV